MSKTERPPEWYRDWFGEEYLALYPHRDQEEAEAGVALMLDTCGAPSGLLLDVACGAGRHMLEFERRGVSAVGIDLSAPLLRQAHRRNPQLMMVRGDMRHLPFATGSFQQVANFFTSFGYFAEPDEDIRVLEEIRRVLEPGGCFALDFLNAPRVRRGLVEEDERRLDKRRVVQRRHLEEDGEVVVKTIQIFDAGHTKPAAEYYERVRLYSREELEEMLRQARLEPQASYGDYHGSPLLVNSPRCILMGRAT